MALQIHAMAEEKEKHVAQIGELEASVAELLSKSGGASRCRVNLVTAAQELLHVGCKWV